MQIEIVRKELSKELETDIRLFFDRQAFRTVFQSPDFYHFYKEVPHYNPTYFIAKDKDGQVIGLLLAVLIQEGNALVGLLSRRCLVYGGPMAENDHPGIIELLIRHLNKAIKHKAVFTQFRNFRQWPAEVQQVFEANGFILHDHLNSLVDLQLTETVSQQFSAGRRRQLNKALREGITISAAQNTDEVDAFYDLLEKLYKHKVKKPLPGRAYFQHFFSNLMPKGAGVILLIWKDRQLIGGIASPITPGYSIAELYIVGLDREYPSCYPSVVATWAAMDYGQRMGLQCFDFMGLGKPDVPYGVRDFKFRFGGSRVNLGRYAKTNNKFLYGLAELGYNVWRRRG